MENKYFYIFASIKFDINEQYYYTYMYEFMYFMHLSLHAYLSALVNRLKRGHPFCNAVVHQLFRFN